MPFGWPVTVRRSLAISAKKRKRLVRACIQSNPHLSLPLPNPDLRKLQNLNGKCPATPLMLVHWDWMGGMAIMEPWERFFLRGKPGQGIRYSRLPLLVVSYSVFSRAVSFYGLTHPNNSFVTSIFIDSVRHHEVRCRFVYARWSGGCRDYPWSIYVPPPW